MKYKIKFKGLDEGVGIRYSLNDFFKQHNYEQYNEADNFIMFLKLGEKSLDANRTIVFPECIIIYFNKAGIDKHLAEKWTGNYDKENHAFSYDRMCTFTEVELEYLDKHGYELTHRFIEEMGQELEDWYDGEI